MKYYVDHYEQQDNSNKYAVVKRDGCVWFPKPVLPEKMYPREALFFAAYIVAAVDTGGYQFQEILRQVRKL